VCKLLYTILSATPAAISLCDQPPRSTQPGHPFVGRHNEYQPKDDALRLGSKAGMIPVWVAGKTV